MVKREDEQAFAELNAANPIFVEDAARLFYGAINSWIRAYFGLPCYRQPSRKPALT